MTGPGSALYFGRVVHQRQRPRRHLLGYRVWFALLDLDELPALAAACRLFSHNRFNLFSFHDRDHGDGSGTGLRGQVERHLAAAGIDLAGGAIRLLATPRLLGYAFNPLSVYFCHQADGGLRAILYEVNNTFGQRHGYLIPVDPAGAGAIVRQSCTKNFYVSPFIGMAMTYHFAIAPPGPAVAVEIRVEDAEGLLLTARFAGRRAPFTDRSLWRGAWRYPLMTFKVIAGIHWEALRIWLKGVRLQPRPAPPSRPVTIVTAASRGS